MLIKDIINKFDKSNIKAGDGLEKGKYPLYTCSPVVNKYLNSYLFDDEALVLSTGGNFSVHYVNGKFNYSTDCYVFNTDKYNLRYLFYYLISKTEDINKMFRGAGLKHLNKNEFVLLNIKDIDFQEQERIVEKLDNINKLIEIKKHQIEKCDILIKSQFVEMFGDPIINEKGWKVDIINDVAPSQNYKGEFDDKVWLLNLDMIESNSGKVIDYVYEDRKNIGNSTCTFNEENVLYSKLRPYLNKVVLPNQKGFATSELVPLKPKKETLNRFFLAYLLRSDQFVQYISEKVTGAKMPRVSMDIFRNFNLILPPMEHQIKFAKFVEQVDKQKFEFEKQLKKLEELQASLMQEYFG